MASSRKYTGRSPAGDVGEALRAAVAAARQDLNSNFFVWKLDRVSGTVGGFVNARDVAVTIAAGEPASARAPAARESEGKCREWYAWHDRMPGKKPTLHVSGTCTFPTSGYVVKLVPRSPQGVNPSIYILDKVVQNPEGPILELETDVSVHFRRQTASKYSRVHIQPDDVVVDVMEVS
jgi:hypothetical protein